MQTVAALCRVLLPDARSDGALVAAFADERDEVAFLELIRRHGPLVWGVCRRLLPHPADAEDAFQAAFLVLVSQSRKLGARDAIGPWLYRVAVLTARNLRRKNARRLTRQRELSAETPVTAPNADLKADLDGALLALPNRYREPIILCHLQGFTRREAAERLGCAEGTLSAWLNRGLAKLRTRLRDLDPAKALSVPVVAVPAALVTNTAQAAVASGVALATVPPAVSSLVEGVLRMFWIKKATAAALALCAVFVLGAGLGLGIRPVGNVATAQDRAPEDRTGEAPLVPTSDEGRGANPLEEQKRAQARLAEVLRRVAEQEERLQTQEKLIEHLRQLEEQNRAKARLIETLQQAAEQDERSRAVNKLNELLRRAAGGYLELTVSRVGDAYTFVLWEVPSGKVPGRKPFGPVTVRDPVALQVLLTRAKTDPTGPNEVHIVAEPTTATSSHPYAALTACDAAGYKTVKFTGYVPTGERADTLKEGQTGAVRGYKRHDDTEVKPKELADEIEKHTAPFVRPAGGSRR